MGLSSAIAEAVLRFLICLVCILLVGIGIGLGTGWLIWG